MLTVPLVVALASFLSIVCDLKANALWFAEEGRRVIRRVLSLESRVGRINPSVS